MSTILPVVETFHTLQGEGMHAGTSAFFIRLGGCSVGCPWCDTKESWPMHSHTQIPVKELAQETAIARHKGAAILVITGGEPLHHNLNELCNAIQEQTTTNITNPIPIHLETSGVNQISGILNWITLSPKRHAYPQKQLLKECNEIKVIIHEKQDLLFAEEIASLSIHEKNITGNQKCTYPDPHLFLQPRWDSKQGVDLAIEHIKSNPKWRLSLQVHKWLGVP